MFSMILKFVENSEKLRENMEFERFVLFDVSHRQWKHSSFELALMKTHANAKKIYQPRRNANILDENELASGSNGNSYQ